MTTLTLDTKRFEPGTTGWTAADLDDPAFEPLWEAGHYEILEGALTTMPAAYFDPAQALYRLTSLLSQDLRSRGMSWEFAFEADLILSDTRVVRPDALYLTAEDKQLLRDHWRRAGRRPERGRVFVRPTLVIENISSGQELQDRKVKRRWYAEAGIPHYWILDAQQRSLECLVLDGHGGYRTDVLSKGDETIAPSFPPDVSIASRELWVE